MVAAGHSQPRPKIVSWLRKEGLWADVSPQEAAFLCDKEPERKAYVGATWRAEALYVLLWALGKIEKLAKPAAICQEPLHEIVPYLKSPKQFLRGVSLRPQKEIDARYEETYQARWKVVDARLNGKPAPKRIDPGVVYERHYALNWLKGYMGQDWDDITTDT